LTIKEFKRILGIYQIKNNLNSESYVGSSKNISKKLIEHINQTKNIFTVKRNSRLYRAINKYNILNFTVQVIEFTTIDRLINK
jgi:group I intron endonuclease